MIVRELIEILKDCDPDARVVLTPDEEMNGQNPLEDVYQNYRYDEKKGELGYETLTKEMENAGFGQEDLLTTGERAVVLRPKY